MSEYIIFENIIYSTITMGLNQPLAALMKYAYDYI